MIIVDLNQIMISNLMVQINGRNAVELSEDLVRHMILNSIRGINKKFRKEYANFGKQVRPVGSLPSDKSVHGIVDLNGNVSEWTANWYTSYKNSKYKDR